MDGLIDDRGYVENDRTLDILTKQALNQANAGADINAPSDDMAGSARFATCSSSPIITMFRSAAYAAKYASAFTVRSAMPWDQEASKKGNKKTYRGSCQQAMKRFAKSPLILSRACRQHHGRRASPISTSSSRQVGIQRAGLRSSGVRRCAGGKSA
jgi:hypothetical protein